jgi:hypothetical protein
MPYAIYLWEQETVYVSLAALARKTHCDVGLPSGCDGYKSLGDDCKARRVSPDCFALVSQILESILCMHLSIKRRLR